MNNEHKNVDVSDVHVAHKVLAYIEKENVHPRSRWYFVCTNELFWVLCFISICIGALSFAIILLTYFNTELGLYRIDYDSLLSFVLEWIPVIWMISFFLFTYVGYKNIQHTKRGYKYSLSAVVLVNILLSIVGGIAIYTYGFASVFDRGFEKHIPGYRSIVTLKRDIALQPRRGGIAGEIIDIDKDFSSFTIKDFKGSVWVVSTEELTSRDKDVVSQFAFVRVIGIPSTTTIGLLSTSTIYACAVIPWEIKGDVHNPVPQDMRPETMQRKPLERKENLERNSLCKGVQPYLIIQEMRDKANQ